MQFYCTTATCLRLVVIDMVLEHVTAPLKANDWHLLFFFFTFILGYCNHYNDIMSWNE